MEQMKLSLSIVHNEKGNFKDLENLEKQKDCCKRKCEVLKFSSGNLNKELYIKYKPLPAGFSSIPLSSYKK